MATQVSDTGSKGRTRGSASDELALIAQRAQAFTNASGTAIALSEGSADEIVCRARSGASAPDVGTALRVEGSFTGLCIQSGKELRCDDAETDTRVDTAAIRALGIRSMVVTPIKEENRVVGVLAVFAPTAHAFTITHVAVLKTMADQISLLLQKERRTKEEGGQPEPSRPAAPAATPRPVAAPPSVPAPVVVKPAVSAPAPRAAFPVVSKVEPIKTTVVADDISTPVALPKREERGAEHKTDSRPGLASFDAAASEDKKSGVSLIVLGVAAVAVIGVASTFAYLKMRKPGPPAAPVAQHLPATPNPAAVQPAAAAVAPAATTQPSSPVAASSAPAVSRAAENSASSSSRAERVPLRNSVPERSAVAERSAPEKGAPEPETVALSTAPSKIAGAAADSGQTQDAAPSLTVGGASGSGALSALAKSTASSKPSMMTQSDLQPIQVLKRVAPTYPMIARQRRLSGVVVVQAEVGKDGKVSNMQLISGPPVFREAAFEALKQWRFKPATLNGQPIEQATQIRMDFTP